MRSILSLLMVLVGCSISVSTMGNAFGQRTEADADVAYLIADSMRTTANTEKSAIQPIKVQCLGSESAALDAIIYLSETFPDSEWQGFDASWASIHFRLAAAATKKTEGEAFMTAGAVDLSDGNYDYAQSSWGSACDHYDDAWHDFFDGRDKFTASKDDYQSIMDDFDALYDAVVTYTATL